MEKIAELGYVLLCDPPYNVRCQRKLENTAHNMFEQNDTEIVGHLAKTFISLVFMDKGPFCASVFLVVGMERSFGGGD